MNSDWVSMKQACDILRISLSTLRRRIEKGEIESKLEGNKRSVLIHHNTSSDTSTTERETLTDIPLTEQLKCQIETLQKQLDKRETETETLQKELSQNRERSDMIIMQLTRQLEQSQRILTAHKEPWYKRWFRKKE